MDNCELYLRRQFRHKSPGYFYWSADFNQQVEPPNLPNVSAKKTGNFNQKHYSKPYRSIASPFWFILSPICIYCKTTIFSICGWSGGVTPNSGKYSLEGGGPLTEKTAKQCLTYSQKGRDFIKYFKTFCWWCIFIKAVPFLCTEKAKFGPILAILLRIYAPFDVLWLGWMMRWCPKIDNYQVCVWIQ